MNIENKIKIQAQISRFHSRLADQDAVINNVAIHLNKSVSTVRDWFYRRSVPERFFYVVTDALKAQKEKEQKENNEIIKNLKTWLKPVTANTQ